MTMPNKHLSNHSREDRKLNYGSLILSFFVLVAIVIGVYQFIISNS